VEFFQQQYRELFRTFPDCVVVEEKDFHKDFLEVLEKLETEYVLFGVDDVVYFDSVDFDVILKTFETFGGDALGFSLRFGQQSIERGGDDIQRDVIGGQEVFSIDWTKGQTANSSYPFELCATIYPSKLVKQIIKNTQNQNRIIRSLFSPGSMLIRSLGTSRVRHKILRRFGYFYAPNPLESWNCRWCQNHSSQLPSRLYFQKLCASAIQVNMVNTATANEIGSEAEYTVETLAVKYEQGARLDIDFLMNNKPTLPHSNAEYFVLSNKRDDQ
jgi:hypothetical protein